LSVGAVRPWVKVVLLALAGRSQGAAEIAAVRRASRRRVTSAPSTDPGHVPALALENVSVAFGGRSVLRGLTLRVEVGELLVLVRVNGSASPRCYAWPPERWRRMPVVSC
jgi:hypothetical protein